MSLRVLQSGPLATLQDWGRFAQQHNGCSVSGPMDEHAFLWAQKLVGNQLTDAVIEIALGNVEFECTQPTQIALCGAYGDLQLNGAPIEAWRSHQLQAGDKLRVLFFKTGMYAYLAVRGGFTVARQLGSAACTVREGIGGRALQGGDEIPYAAYNGDQQIIVPYRFRPDYADDMSIAVHLTYQAADFAETERERFFHATYELQAASNRMGLRLQGTALSVPEKVYPSEGIAYGAIQIPPNGQPIIMAKERQNIGGYPKIACVTVMDMSRIAQARPGTRVHFYEADLAASVQALHERNQFFGLKRSHV